MIDIVKANTDERIAQAKALFQEYAESLGFDLCFQNFDVEMDRFPDQYSPPRGGLFLALSQNRPIGCVGVRYFDEGICEMKRLYVRPAFRGKHAGRNLAVAAIEAGKTLGYKQMRLDTLRSMERANQLYKTLGFVEIEPYRKNPLDGAIYFELRLER
jgi:ribosomal protein S18 acetylase RimI-like enzyme